MLNETLLNKYFLLSKHQSGGMASIYKAITLDESRNFVAVKRFERDKQIPEIETEAYSREVEALQNLQHENILRILDQNEDDQKRPFLVLEWMERDLIEHKFQGDSAFDGWDSFVEMIGAPLAEALAYAHAHGISHRDVKPANVLIAKDGSVKLADFGISKLKQWLAPRITLNEFVSRPYAPPEIDDGSYSYSRDVFAFGVVCIWALSPRAVTSYSEIAPALADLDIIPEVRRILERCVNLDPRMRPETAGVLSMELTRVQNRRRQTWLDKNRKKCQIKLTKKSSEAVANFIDSTKEQDIRGFIEQDINDCSTIDWVITGINTPNERLVSNHFQVLGSQFTYQIALDASGRDEMILVNARGWSADQLQKWKSNKLASPYIFTLTSGIGTLSATVASKEIAFALAEFEEKREQDYRKTTEEALFTTWSSLLDAKADFERERIAPIKFTSARMEESFIILETENNLDGVVINQPRVIDQDRKKIKGVVYQINGNEIVLSCPGGPPESLPRSGMARLDTMASDIATSRQRTAIENVRSGNSVRADLRDLLLDPTKARSPQSSEIGLYVQGQDLDPFQKDALLTALDTQDILLVQGPPGTGKTRFIVRLIQETLARNPRAKIMVSSQTHVAIDNALEQLASKESGLRILRFARAGATTIATFSQPYLLSNQFDQWRDEVERGSKNWLNHWATQRGIDPELIETGSLLGQIAAIRQGISKLRSGIQEAQTTIDSLRSQIVEPDDISLNSEIDEIENANEDDRVQLDSDKRFLDRLEAQLKNQSKDADDLLKLPPEQIAEWSELYIGESSDRRQAAKILDLRSRWLERFRENPTFYRALCDRSSIIFKTCVGMESDLGDVSFDLCILDEASKATATEALVPMTRAKRWVFVGDSKQLPPFEDQALRNSDLRKRHGVEAHEATESLFERLRRLLPAECKKSLSRQYRMVPPIGHLISECFYDGELQSEPRELDPDLISVTGRAVSWITTRTLTNRHEERAEGSFLNQTEVDRILDLLVDIQHAVAESKKPTSVLILSGYSAQVILLRRSVLSIKNRLPQLSIECSTIDSVQGREAAVVLFSVTRSNEDAHVGFLRELQRINVALSRAMNLLVIIGDDGFIRRSTDAEPLHRVIRHIEKHKLDCNLREFNSRGDID